MISTFLYEYGIRNLQKWLLLWMAVTVCLCLQVM